MRLASRLRAASASVCASSAADQGAATSGTAGASVRSLGSIASSASRATGSIVDAGLDAPLEAAGEFCFDAAFGAASTRGGGGAFAVVAVERTADACVETPATATTSSAVAGRCGDVERAAGRFAGGSARGFSSGDDPGSGLPSTYSASPRSSRWNSSNIAAASGLPLDAARAFTAVGVGGSPPGDAAAGDDAGGASVSVVVGGGGADAIAVVRVTVACAVAPNTS